MTRVAVSVESDHLDKLAKPSRRLAGVCELIWNALDAEADKVIVRVIEGPVGGVDSVEIIDNGHGISHADALHDFQLLGGSWKRARRISKNNLRDLHGSEGEGRWRAYSLGDLIRWHSVADLGEDRGRQRVRITGSRNAIKEFDVTEPVPSEDPVGTLVTVENISAKAATALLAEDALNLLNAEFALYLEKYPTVEVVYRGSNVDPNAIVKHRETYTLDVDDSLGPAELTVIEWAKDVRRSLLLCDSGGMPLGEVAVGIQAPYFEFTAYLRWDGIREHASDLQTPDFNEDLQPVIEAARDQMRSHFKGRANEVEGEVIEEWKEQQVYPYAEPAATSTEVVEREVFDLVAVTASRAVNTTSDRQSRRLSLRLIREALAQDPGSLHRVLRDVLDLPKERLEELALLLERTTLSAIIAASRVVADRLDFLQGLEEMLFEADHKAALLERTQLHRMLANEPWIFGDEYALAVDEGSLTSVLAKHIAILGRTELAPGEPHVLREDGTPGRVDLMLAKSIKLPTQQHEHLVVELKRPTIVIGPAQLTQIQSYAMAVAEDERFAKTNTRWNFWVISNKLDTFAERTANQANRPPGLVFEDESGVQIWAKTWSQVLDDCRQRLKFVEANLEIQSSSDSALDFLRRTYERFLPRTLAGEDDGQATA